MLFLFCLPQGGLLLSYGILAQTGYDHKHHPSLHALEYVLYSNSYSLNH